MEAIDGGVGKGVGMSSKDRLRRLRWWNIVVGLILAAQALVIAVLSDDFSLPVVATYIGGPPGTEPSITKIGVSRSGGACSPSWRYPRRLFSLSPPRSVRLVQTQPPAEPQLR